MKVLSKASVYGLRALVYLASHKPDNELLSIGEISEKLDISFHFLTKTFQTLSQNGILESHRGPNGGVALKKPASDIFLIDIVYAIEGQDFFNKCLLGLPGCGVEKPCPVHDLWAQVRNRMKVRFEQTSLAELAHRVSTERLRLGEV